MSGTLDLEKLFLEKFTEKYQLNERDLKRAFAKFDKDKSGVRYISFIYISTLLVNYNIKFFSLTYTNTTS